MKRRIVCLLLLLAVLGCLLPAQPVSAADYEALRLKPNHLTVGHYTNSACTSEIVQHSANPNYEEEIACLVDNDKYSFYMSNPYKFSSLYDNGGTTIPAILIDVAASNNGEPLAVAAFDMRLRSSYDCRPLHVKLQVTTTSNSSNWITVAEKRFSISDWDESPTMRIEFAEITAYKFRILAVDIGEPDYLMDDYKDYATCKGDETRFALAEIDLLQIKGSGGSTQQPPTGGQPSTRPEIQISTTSPAPTQPSTQKPTQPATQGATQKPTTQAPTPAPTQKPTQAPTQKPTQAPTQKPTQSSTQPIITPTQPAATPTQPATKPTAATTAPGQPTVAPVEPTLEPTQPTVETALPTSAPLWPDSGLDTAPTEFPGDGTSSEAPTKKPSKPSYYDDDDYDDDDEDGSVLSWVIPIIIAICAGCGVGVFLILKKKP